jgi:hypothetical protein
MKITPKTEEEIAAMNLWPEGEYGFEVLEQATLGQDTHYTQDTKSKVKANGSGGNDMIKLVVNVYNPEGQSRVVMDYLLEALPRKLRNACYGIGIGDKYEGGEFSAADFIGKKGNLKLKIEKGGPREDNPNEKYADKNTIADYVLTDQPTPMPPPHDGLVEDGVPF